MKKTFTLSIILMMAAGIIVIDGCKKSNPKIYEPYNPTYLTLQIPAGWPQPPQDIYINNPLTEEGFQLGKKLFYDGKLSKDGNFPCASCHQQFAAFATYDHDFSHGYNNSFTTRNAPATFNLAWMTSLHWDGSINHIEVEPLSPINDPVQMGDATGNVISKLSADTSYQRMFRKAFGDETISSQRMLKALSQFMGSLISSNSKYDKVKRGETSFTSNETNGYNIFKAKCEACHKEPLFTDNSFRNNGLALNLLNDKGRMKITGFAGDSLKFKVPTLRNAALTFPYMHDGHLYSLGQVIDHYRTGIITTQPTLDPLLVTRLPMTTAEKNDLVYFLYTLTDSVLINSPRFAQ